jgi:iduronate 2-sulfatase
MNDFTTNQPFENNKVFAAELYDYVKDPFEKYNVVDDKNYTTISKEMKSNMLQFFAAQVRN